MRKFKVLVLSFLLGLFCLSGFYFTRRKNNG